MFPIPVRRLIAFVLLVSSPPAQTPEAPDYDPLRVDTAATTAALPLSVRDDTRDRDVPIRVYVPPGDDPAPVVLFSHGLGGSRDTSPYLGEHWARRGYVAGNPGAGQLSCISPADVCPR
jgi:predicted dienelactone hydrolase